MKHPIRTRFGRKVRLFFNGDMMRLVILTVCTLAVAASLAFIFEGGADGTQVKTLAESFWMTVVTFTTTGYGDKIPVTWAGRIIMMFTMFSGIIVAGLLTGQIAGVLVQRSIERARGFINMEKKKGHFIICGWKKDMEKVVEQILVRNDELTADDIVVIAQLPDDQLMAIKQNETFKSIDIIKGDYFSEAVLNRANVKQATKVLILADDNKNISTSEVDSRTVMTAMTIESIAKDTYVVAELIDKKFEPYLRMARVDEIIMSREYGRSLIANTCLSSGIAHVVHDLLDVHNSTSVTTKEIPENLIGKTFADLSSHYKSENAILIGVLENTGNVFRMKRDAIRDAQKNADISKIVERLKQTKALRANHPVLNPGDDFVIPKHSAAILIETLRDVNGATV
jgi:voltage-gated potassium channel